MNTTADTITQIPLEQLHESPFNPRKTFTAIDELAASIKAEGRIHQPLLVRPRMTNPLRDDVIDGYEVVFGHRRLRAAAAAGLASVPCMVRAMSNAEARSAQIAENLARTDVHPIEEAEGFAAMLEHDGLSADELATLVGKSRSYVYGRLKLLEAVPRVREACLRGEIGSEVALLVARVGGAKLQEKALARIKAVGANMGDGGKASFRRIKAELADNFTLELKGAIFDREDAELLPGAGVCSACPKRSGNSPLFEDVATQGLSRWESPTHRDNGEPNRCTDPDCWEAKTKAHLAQVAAKLEATGVPVVTGNKARQALDAHGMPRNGYLPLERVKAELKKKTAQPVPVVHLVNQRTGKIVKAVRREDLVAAGLAKAEKPADKTESRADQERRERERQERHRAEAEAETESRRRLLLAVRDAAEGRERSEFELRLVAAAALAGVGYHDHATLRWLYGRSVDQLKLDINAMGPQQLTRLLLDCAIVDNVYVPPHFVKAPMGPLLALAEHYGIDAQAAMQAPAQPPAEGTPTPSTAAASGKKRVAPKGAAYWCAETGETWSGKGQRPAWLRAKLAAGFALEDFAAGAAKKVKDDAGSAGEQDTKTAGLFEAEEAQA